MADEKKPKDLDVYDLEAIPNIGPVGAEHLRKNDIESYFDIIVFGDREVMNITKMDKDKAIESVEWCQKQLEENKLLWQKEMTADKLLDIRKSLLHIPTGCDALDELLDGGVEAKAITEFAGKFGSGKTQISHSLAVTTVANETLVDKKGNKPMVLYFDTENTCRPERLFEIAMTRGLAKTEEEASELLSRIDVKKASSPAELVMIIQRAMKIIKGWNIRLVIIDSGTALFRQQNAEFGDQGRKYRLMNRMNHLLTNMAEIYNVPVVFINQMYTSTSQFDPGDKQYGGNVIGHAMTYRLTLKKKSKVWVATSVDFPHKAIQDVEFLLTEKGIVNAPSKKKAAKK
jgi:DNA repair protein RadA